MAHPVDQRQGKLWLDTPVTPVIRLIDTLPSRPEVHPIVLKLVKDGTLDFLDVIHLPPGVKEPKVEKRRFGTRPKFWKKPESR